MFGCMARTGRPRKITEEVLRKLEQAFLMGCTDLEACVAADIGARTLYDYCAANPEFSQRKETLKTNPTMRAKMVEYEAICEKDLKAAQEYLKRKEGSKVAVTGNEGGPLETKTVIEFINAPHTDA